MVSAPTGGDDGDSAVTLSEEDIGNILKAEGVFLFGAVALDHLVGLFSERYIFPTFVDYTLMAFGFFGYAMGIAAARDGRRSGALEQMIKSHENPKPVPQGLSEEGTGSVQSAGSVALTTPDTGDGYHRLWVDLSAGPRQPLDNHLGMRKDLRRIAGAYPVEFHDGVFDTQHPAILPGIPRQIQASLYAMARAKGEHVDGLTQFRDKLLEDSRYHGRVIGPTVSASDLREYGDNFELHKLIRGF